MMIQVALDWNCIIELEAESPVAHSIRQIQAWYNQGKVVPCISAPSRLENPQDHGAVVIDEVEWNRKLNAVGLGGIELRSARTNRAFRGADGSYLFDSNLELLILQEIHTILFPNIDFAYSDYCRRCHVEPISLFGFLNLSAAHRAASEEQQRVTQKWNNKKCDALSLHAYSTWAEPDDLFVTTDKNFHRKKEQLFQPFHLPRTVLAPPPGSTRPYPVGTVLTEQVQTIVLPNVIRGHIMMPQEAVEYLQMRLG
jgi:hypothetical protein